MKNKLILLIFTVLLGGIVTAAGQDGADRKKGDAKALETAERMLKAIGGRANWAALKSLYIRAIHTEAGLDKPYQNEIWRNLETRQIKIVQQNEDFHTVGYIDGDKGWIVRGRGEPAAMSEEQLAGLLHWDRHLVYGIFRKMAAGSPGLGYRIDERGRLVVEENGEMLAAFELNEKGLPHRFYTPSRDGKKENLSIFSEWGESEGFVHPVVSEPQGEQTVYRAQEWRPGREMLEMRFSPGPTEEKKETN